MTPEVAERVLALAAELTRAHAIGDAIAADTASFDAGQSEMLLLAAERGIERTYQAAAALPDAKQAEYFGAAAIMQLRGMRNRLAHNYLGVEHRIVRGALQEQVPRVLARMATDLALARVRMAAEKPDALGSGQWGDWHLSTL